MYLTFERVFPDDDKKIEEIYEIIKSCGEYMFRNQGLFHWRTPYSRESIKKNCKEREVFLVKDIVEKKYVHTFQLEFIFTSLNDEAGVNIVNIHKFATLPQVAGRGIGKQSMSFIEDYCRKKDVSKIRLDVYEKSEYAIQFYKNRGFKIIGKKHTRHFIVYIMEKLL